MGSPTTTPLNEVRHDGGFLVSEANGHRSRDRIMLTGAALVLAGTVLGIQSAGAVASAVALGTNTGNGTFGTITPTTNPVTQIGNYSLVYTSATAFTVTAPGGETATGVNGSAFSALGIGFTMTTGGTPMVAGDSFTIAVTATPGIPTATATAAVGNTGNSTCSAVTVAGYAAQVGVYTVEFDAATQFIVSDPTGAEVGNRTTGTAFKGGGLSFTITAGGTAFVAGDSFTITVANGSGKYAPLNPAAVDGTQNASAILFGQVDVTLADKHATGIVRSCEVNASELIWPAGMSAAAIAVATAQLSGLGIISR
jgi:hypothetical protein